MNFEPGFINNINHSLTIKNLSSNGSKMERIIRNNGALISLSETPF